MPRKIDALEALSEKVTGGKAGSADTADNVQYIADHYPEGSSYTLPAATSSALGGVKQAAAQADSEATDAASLVTDFNALLAKLRTAGILHS